MPQPSTTSRKQIAFAALACFLQLGASAPNLRSQAPPPLPHKISDGEDYATVLARFHAAVPRYPRRGHHIHSDLRLININGEESTATVDQWQINNLSRWEEKAANWSSASFADGKRRWSVEEGIQPMRLWGIDGFPDLFSRPGPAERRIRIYAPKNLKLEKRKLDGVTLSCSGMHAGAEICFDSELGLPIEATVDDEQVIYKGWAGFDGVLYPNRLALYRGRRLQMEVSIAITALTSADEVVFRVPPGASEHSYVHPPPYAYQSHRIAHSIPVDTNAFGDAQVRVFVDDTGKVRRAELLDADDKDLGAAALNAARQTVYEPDQNSGERQAFEGEFFVFNWSTVDPWRIEATSRASLGTD